MNSSESIIIIVQLIDVFLSVFWPQPRSRAHKNSLNQINTCFYRISSLLVLALLQFFSFHFFSPQDWSSMKRNAKYLTSIKCAWLSLVGLSCSLMWETLNKQWLQDFKKKRGYCWAGVQQGGFKKPFLFARWLTRVCVRGCWHNQTAPI